MSTVPRNGTIRWQASRKHCRGTQHRNRTVPLRSCLLGCNLPLWCIPVQVVRRQTVLQVTGATTALAVVE
jgi:hypothetical protein